MMNDSILSCRNLSKNFGYHSALSGVNMIFREAGLSVFWDQTEAERLHL